ncbi:hypothetical protein K456DRAFT_48547 [Colletotrichum gloeosporioides 23]|nr:hypothetical protein K456DRAFT_48547 [Colletotrichum gloeosporioides 23]
MVPAFTTFFVAVSTATPVLSAAVMSPIAQRDTGAGLEYDPSVIGTPAWDAFQAADVLSEIDADTDATNVFVLQCVDAGFKGNCLVFGAPVGKCVTFTSFSASIDKTYEDQVTSLSTNTGTKCHFYKNHACNAGGHDPGFQTAYDFDLSVDHAEYNNAISSWKC